MAWRDVPALVIGVLLKQGRIFVVVVAVVALLCFSFCRCKVIVTKAGRFIDKTTTAVVTQLT